MRIFRVAVTVIFPFALSTVAFADGAGFGYNFGNWATEQAAHPVLSGCKAAAQSTIPVPRLRSPPWEAIATAATAWLQAMFRLPAIL